MQDKKAIIAKVRQALKKLGYKNVSLTVREADTEDTVIVDIDGNYFGVFDHKRETFAD